MQMRTLAWKTTITLLHILALTFSFFRIVQRWRTKLLGCDDYAVSLAALLDTLVLVLFWMQYKPGNVPLGEDNATGNVSFLFSWWTFFLLGCTVIWVSRIAISLSLSRIYPPRHPHRKAAILFVAFLFSLYCVCILLPTFCCRGKPWWNLDIANCKDLSASQMSAVLFAFDFGSDLLLIIGPVHALWKIKFPRAERTLLLSLFSSSLLTLLATLSYCVVYYVISKSNANDGSAVMFMSHVQISVSLIAANLLVVTMTAFRAIRRRYGPFKRVPPPARPRTPAPPPEVLEEPTDDQETQTQPASTPIILTVLSDSAYMFESYGNTYDDSSASLPEKDWPGKVLKRDSRAAISLP